MMHRVVLLLLHLVIFEQTCQAKPGIFHSQLEQIRFQQLDSEDGLTVNMVTAFAQDEEGFLWVGTQHGLNRFDGFEFKHYFHNETDLESLSNSTIWTLLLDREFRLWVGTQNGLNIYEPDGDIFRRIELSGLGNETVREVIEDSSGRLWVGSSRGLYRQNRQGSFEREQLIGAGSSTSMMDDGTVQSMYEDSFGRLWVGTEGSGIFFRDKSNHFRRFGEMGDVVSKAHVRDFIEDNDGRIWVSTFDNGIILLDPLGEVVLGSVDIGTNRVRALHRGNRGNVWIGSEKGLYKWKDGEVYLYENDPRNEFSLINNSVVEIYSDAGGVIWIGTFGGISRWNSSLPSPESFRPTLMFPNKEIDQWVTAIEEAVNGDVWIGTYGGLIRWGSSQSQFSHLDATSIGLSDGRITALKSHGDEIWIGTVATGIQVVRDDEPIASYRYDSQDDSSLSSDAITDIFRDSRGRLWISTFGSGLNLYVGDGKFERLPLTKDVGSFTGLRSMAIEEDQWGNIWVGTMHKGVRVYNPETKDVKILRPGRRKAFNIMSLRNSAERMWIGTTGQGMFYYEFDSGELKSFKESKIKNPIYAIEEDDSGDVWFSSTRGVSVIRDRTELVERFDSSHGFQRGDFNQLASKRLADGGMVFGGSTGFVLFDPKALKKNLYPPQVALTKIEIDGISVNSRRQLRESGNISLGHTESSFRVEFSALDYTYPAKNLYKYKLEGFDKNWIGNGTDRDITYTNLDPGSYVLRVRGSNNDGVWSEKELTIPIVVEPPLWATWWAYTLYTLFALAVAYLIFQMNVHKRDREAEERFNYRLQLYLNSLDETSECVFNASPEGRVLFANNTAGAILDKSPGEIIGFPLFEILFQSKADESHAITTLEEAGQYQAEIHYEMKDGEEKILEVTISTVDQPSDDVAYVGVARDVTEQSRAREDLQRERDELERQIVEKSEELERTIKEVGNIERTFIDSDAEKERLLRGIHDRVNENLQMLTSLLSIQTSKSTDSEAVRVLEDSQRRIKTVALVHEHLYGASELRGVDMARYLDSLVSGLYRRHQPDGVNIYLSKEVDEFLLDIDLAVPCGLIVSELMTNALEHGFAEKKYGSGNVSLTFQKTPRECILTISDDGRGLPPDTNLEAAGSMGIEIVSILTSQLSGEFKLVGGLGTTFEVRFPLS